MVQILYRWQLHRPIGSSFVRTVDLSLLRETTSKGSIRLSMIMSILKKLQHDHFFVCVTSLGIIIGNLAKELAKRRLHLQALCHNTWCYMSIWVIIAYSFALFAKADVKDIFDHGLRLIHYNLAYFD